MLRNIQICVVYFNVPAIACMHAALLAITGQQKFCRWSLHMMEQQGRNYIQLTLH